jgi:hypothetical protein
MTRLIEYKDGTYVVRCEDRTFSFKIDRYGCNWKDDLTGISGRS